MSTEKQIIKEFKRVLLSSPESEWKVKERDNWDVWRLERVKSPFLFIEKIRDGWMDFVPHYKVRLGIEYGELVQLSKWNAFLLRGGIRRIKKYWIKVFNKEKEFLREDILERKEKELVKFLGAIKKA
jgi:hypothetical protein